MRGEPISAHSEWSPLVGNDENVIRSAENLSDPLVAAWCGGFGMKIGVRRPIGEAKALHIQAGTSGAMAAVTLACAVIVRRSYKEESLNGRISSMNRCVLI